MMTSISGRLRGVQGGKLRAIAVSGRARSPQLPDVATIAESCYPGFEVITWFGLVAPSGTPQPVIQRLNHEVLEALKVPGVRDQYTRIGFEILPNSPDEFTRFIADENVIWGGLIKELNLSVQ